MKVELRFDGKICKVYDVKNIIVESEGNEIKLSKEDSTKVLKHFFASGKKSLASELLDKYGELFYKEMEDD